MHVRIINYYILVDRWRGSRDSRSDSKNLGSHGVQRIDMDQIQIKEAFIISWLVVSIVLVATGT